MSERKVLNKYYPPDFDPSKIPRLRLPKNRQYTVRIMAPCNMRCNTCGDYIARGKKFNARKETVEHEEYLGLKVFRFYFKCPRCMQEITFKTDPKNYDYTVEHGATPNFKALKLAEQQAIEEKKEKEEEERLNPMKLLENRTKASRREMENLEALEDIREMNQREVIINYDELFRKKKEELELELKRQEEEDERYVQSIFKVNTNENNDQEEIEQEEQFLEEIDPDSYFKDREKPTTTTTSTSSFNPVQTNDTNDCTRNILRHQVVDDEDAGQKSINNNNNNNNNYNKKRKLIQNMIVVKKKSTTTTSNAHRTTNEINSSTTVTAAAASTIASLCNYSGTSSESDSGDN